MVSRFECKHFGFTAKTHVVCRWLEQLKEKQRQDRKKRREKQRLKEKNSLRSGL
jgi:hypothetical protein